MRRVTSPALGSSTSRRSSPRIPATRSTAGTRCPRSRRWPPGSARSGCPKMTTSSSTTSPGSFAAERAWWVLRWVGLRGPRARRRVAAWVDGGPGPRVGRATAGGSHAAGPAPRGSCRRSTSTGRPPSPSDGVLVDGRAGERYRGEVEPHGPAARPHPRRRERARRLAVRRRADAGRRPSSRRRLAPALAAVPGRPAVAAYCGSGVSAARDVLAFAVLGIDAALFPGSWSAWSNDPDRPAAVGLEPGPSERDETLYKAP